MTFKTVQCVPKNFTRCAVAQQASVAILSIGQVLPDTAHSHAKQQYDCEQSERDFAKARHDKVR